MMLTYTSHSHPISPIKNTTFLLLGPTRVQGLESFVKETDLNGAIPTELKLEPRA